MLFGNLLGAAAAGLAAGVLVNYLADVLPITRRLSRPAWWPPGQGQAYFHSGRVWLVQLFFVLAAMLLYRYPPAIFSALGLFLIGAYFALVTVIDLEHRAILHSVSLFGALAFGAWGLLRLGWLSTLLGGAAGFAIMLGLYYLGDLLGLWLARRRNEEWEEVALGFGDVNLAGVIGLLLGWPSVLAGMVLAFLLGGLFSLGHILIQLVRGRYSAFAAVAYGPFLALGAVGLLLLRAYLN